MTLQQRLRKSVIRRISWFGLGRCEFFTPTIEAIVRDGERLEEENEKLKGQIDNAMMAIVETQPSWGFRIYRVMGAFGADFGGPEEIDAGILRDTARSLNYEREDVKRILTEISKSGWPLANDSNEHLRCGQLARSALEIMGETK